MNKMSVFLMIWACFAVVRSTEAQCPNLNPADDGTGQSIGLVISEINPGDFIEVYNFTNSDIELAGTSFQLCSPLIYNSLSTLTVESSVVPAKGYLTLSWPAFFSDADAGGEILLFKDSFFETTASIIDYVCWGINPHFSRKGQAQAAGKWAGDCATVLTGESLHRLAGSDGISADSYDVSSAPSPLDCAPLEPVPAIGQWGLCSMVLLVLIGGTIAIRRGAADPAV